MFEQTYEVRAAIEALPPIATDATLDNVGCPGAEAQRGVTPVSDPPPSLAGGSHGGQHFPGDHLGREGAERPPFLAEPFMSQPGRSLGSFRSLEHAD